MSPPEEKGISRSARNIPTDDEYVDLSEAGHYPAESSTDTHDSTDKQGSLTDELAKKIKEMKQNKDGIAGNTSRPGVLTKPGVSKPASELPKIGKYVAKDEGSYQYLAESIRMHPDQETLQAMMQDAGFDEVKYHNLTDGIVALHIGYKY